MSQNKMHKVTKQRLILKLIIRKKLKIYKLLMKSHRNVYNTMIELSQIK